MEGKPQKKNAEAIKLLLFGNARKKGILYQIIVYGILIILSFVFLFPLFRMLSISLMNTEDLLDASVIWIPNKFALENYREAGSIIGFPNSFRTLFTFNAFYSTLVVVVLPSFLSTIVTCAIGYGFSRFEFPLKKFWLALVIVLFIVPAQIILLPQFVWFNQKLHILGTIYSLVLPATLAQGINASIFILIFYSFFNMIPKVLDESAYIDGAGRFKIFYKIGVPLSIQTMIVAFLFNVVWYWNDSYRASLFLTGSKWTTLVAELTSFEKRYEYLAENATESFVSLNEPLIMAGTILTILPLLILYFATQKHFVESIDKTGLAGGE